MPDRVLVFMLAYNAAKTVEASLARIPGELSCYDTHILVIDDGSKDQTLERIYAFQDAHPDFPFPMTVLKNPINQGYGGNVKIGMHYAVENDFDALCLIHGDGQYPPEKLPELVLPLIEDEADVVFGSRMMNRRDALKGGMPVYKWIGNQVLTWFENKFLNLDLSEFHTGFRLYSVAALKRLPFHLNSNDFHFDTEIIIQFHYAGMRIKELPIPTFYGDETSHVNGLKYAWDVSMQALIASAQRLGLCYLRKYDVAPKPGQDTYFTPKVTFTAAHQLAVDLIPEGSRVLDIGAAGGLAVEVLKRKGCHVTAIDISPPSSDRAADKFIKHDLDQLPLPVEIKDYDYLLALDILGHLREPEKFIESLHNGMTSGAEVKLIATAGNIGFAINRLQLLFGIFNYGKRGILDRSHTRLFTFSSFRRLLEESGFHVTSSKAVEAPFMLAFGNSAISRGLATANRFFARFLPGVFGFRILLSGTATPTLDMRLQDAVDKTPTAQVAKS
tara:strand:+ start:18048 stop:19550 length:1503 start_codon:yes stop_codon:yes gene_type:complete